MHQYTKSTDPLLTAALLTAAKTGSDLNVHGGGVPREGQRQQKP